MSDCERLSDRMPEVVLRAAAWSAEEAVHLTSCADCRAEWDLVLAARLLETRGPSLDPDVIVGAVQRRLASESRAGSRSSRGWVLGLGAAAAAAVALVVTWAPEPRQVPAPAVAVAADPLVPLPELEGLDAAQLDTLLHTLDGPLAGASAQDSTTADDDVDAELEQILATWEG